METEKNTPEAAAQPGPFVLTPENYYSDRANSLFLSNSLFKSIYGCPADPYPCEAKALFGPREDSEALLVGGYVDAAFESDQALQDYIERNRDRLMLKSGKGFYQFVKDADRAIARVKRDPVFMSYLDGDHQKVMTGEIGGHPFKIKMDDYKKGVRITDLKYVKSAQESYCEPMKRRVTFIDAYGYAIQGAIYQEVAAQNDKARLPFYIAYITKEDPADFGVVEIPQGMLDEALEFVKLSLAARPMSDVRAKPHACGRRSCSWCRDQKALTGPYAFDDFEAYSQT
ncbi:MAG: PD-(D/E)XK nuclease-like domain-containing protein [Muribaculaceae bacterium]|nr:PD-(D/E)XK nuclease-like domain-containing protein [Muribaculaceae bacterium]